MTAVDEYRLTDAGWPRPRVGGLPVPWVAPVTNLGSVNEGRRNAGVGGGICQVCGEGFPSGALAFMFTYPPADWVGPLQPGEHMPCVTSEGGTDRYIALDGAVMHYRCAKLTRTMCPHIRDDHHIVLVTVPANDADPLRDQYGILRPTYPAEDCIITEMPGRP